jgi:hypothetical protein
VNGGHPATGFLLGATLVLACATPQEHALATLKADLASVRASEPTTEPVEVRPRFDASVLVGMSRKAILDALPAPARCPDWLPSARAAECDIYPYFKLLPGWAGGGTVLWLVYDGYGQCIRAGWLTSM